jgi:oligopeptide transport system ATP-binding protein
VTGATGERNVLAVTDLGVSYPMRSPLLQRVTGYVHAVAGVSFNIASGETVGLVGESGCGKSTLGRAVCGLVPVSQGAVTYPSDGSASADGSGPGRGGAQQVQMVFQDPFSSLNPGLSVRDIITEGWSINPGLQPRAQWDDGAAELLSAVGLRADVMGRRPKQLSGGERQRVAIARSLAVRPNLLVCDEVTSALDVSVKAQLLQLLARLREETGLAYLFISHDTSAVRRLSQRVLVMYLGKIVESGTAAEVLDHPNHPYTRALLSAIPRLRPWATTRARIELRGEVPSPRNPPAGCRFHNRCWLAQQLGTAGPGGICATVEPGEKECGGSHLSSCHFADQMAELDLTREKAR